MKKFIVDKSLFEEYENLKIGVVICNNINNTEPKSDISRRMDEVRLNVKEKFENVELSEYPVIRKWRDIYKSFGEKKSRSSVESLIRRTVNGKEIPSINPLVDIYNLISLKYEFPCGGEDLDNISGDIELTYANGTETFLPLGLNEEENPNEGEIVYKCGNIIICRNFNYRESDITKLTEQTKNSILVVESIQSESSLDDALNELSVIIKENLGGEIRIAIIDKNNNEIEL